MCMVVLWEIEQFRIYALNGESSLCKSEILHLWHVKWIQETPDHLPAIAKLILAKNFFKYKKYGSAQASVNYSSFYLVHPYTEEC